MKTGIKLTLTTVENTLRTFKLGIILIFNHRNNFKPG